MRKVMVLMIVGSIILVAGLTEIMAAEVIDSLETTAGWNIYNAEGAEVELNSVDGKVGKALEINYDMRDGSWIGIYKDDINLSGCKTVKFFIKGEGSKNSVEFKLEDVDGSNFGILLDVKSNLGGWTVIEIPLNQLTYWWGGDDTLDDYSNVKLHFAISIKDRDEGGSGKVTIDQIEAVGPKAF